ncbi:1474_t:CDS:2, partial [Cetraspora pellucida]
QHQNSENSQETNVKTIVSAMFTKLDQLRENVADVILKKVYQKKFLAKNNMNPDEVSKKLKVAHALSWLKVNNYYYADIIIDNEALQTLSINNSIDNQLQTISENLDKDNEDEVITSEIDLDVVIDSSSELESHDINWNYNWNN